MRIRDTMTRGVETIRPDATLQEAADKMCAMDIGFLPVCEGDRLVGVLTDRDITIRATAKGSAPQLVRAQQIMTPDPIWCFEDQDVQGAVRLMEDKQIRRLLVLNRERRMVGIVSLGDLAVRTGDEELVGQVLEEISEPAIPHRQAA